MVPDFDSVSQELLSQSESDESESHNDHHDDLEVDHRFYEFEANIEGRLEPIIEVDAEYLLSSRGNQELRREDRKEEDEAAE